MYRPCTALVVVALGFLARIEAQTPASTVGPKINTPVALVQCQPAALQYTDAVPPVYITCVRGTEIASNPLVNFPIQNAASGSLTWPAVTVSSDVTDGITFMIKDSTGAINYSGKMQIQSGSDSCNPSTDPSGTSATSGSNTTGTTTGSSSSSTKPVSPSTTPPKSTNSTTTPASTSSSSVKNGTSSSTSSSPKDSTSSSKTTTDSSTTSGSAGTSTINTLVFGAAAGVAAVLLATGLF